MTLTREMLEAAWTAFWANPSSSVRDCVGGAVTAALALIPDAQEAVTLKQEVERLRSLVYVPGSWRCPRCEFTLLQSNLNARDGTVTPRDSPGDKCPNCGGPLWRTTWRDDAQDLAERAAEQLTRAQSAEYDAARFRSTIEWMRARDDRNGSLPDAYRCKIDQALAASELS